MNYKFLKKDGNPGLLLIFGGWSTLPRFYDSLALSGWDLLAVTSYNDLEFPLSLLNGYKTVGLFAWSLGVYVASRIIPDSAVAFAVAINGTLFPSDNEKGIPENIFLATKDNLDERNLLKFRKRMAGKMFLKYQDLFPEKDDINALKNELTFIFENFKENKNRLSDPLKWTRAYISAEDHIFPPENQKNAWSSDANLSDIIEIDDFHLPDLKKIISSILISRNEIGRNFEKSMPVYDKNANAQRQIAQRLSQMSPSGTRERLLEIGPGTGFLTIALFPVLKPVEIDFIDLFPVSPFNIAGKENYFIGDAEEIVESQAGLYSERYDAIISSSAIQWFIDPKKFFRNCAKLLKPDGFLLFSTFSPGNLQELIPYNPFRILYHSAENIRRYLSECFEKVEFAEEKITVNFNSGYESLFHLRDTGAHSSGVNPSDTNATQRLSLLPNKLTYTPLYFLAFKPRTSF